MNAPNQQFNWNIVGVNVTGAGTGNSSVEVDIGFNVFNQADPTGPSNGLGGTEVAQNQVMTFPWTVNQ
ncbi:hypothetical protein SAMN04489725_12510 [Alicyclobacillus hesperidum]|uniref:Uncharacterized protein n=1 Tax=Alicyclobacillus hesperidum TaxID=89784 RepID=A0A1H2XWP8_9BACL|nr:hypothetical protein SAMN04489725_12510 [Alicyclobacillus hesperidum]